MTRSDDELLREALRVGCRLGRARTEWLRRLCAPRHTATDVAGGARSWPL